jgi:cell division protein FtsB
MEVERSGSSRRVLALFLAVLVQGFQLLLIILSSLVVAVVV